MSNLRTIRRFRRCLRPVTRLRKPSATTLLVMSVVLGTVASACTSTSDNNPFLGPEVTVPATSPSPANPDLTVPEGCVEIPAAVSSEKVSLLTDLAKSFNSRSPQFGGQCVAVTVYRQASGKAADLLARGWPTDGSEGPAPVIWSPAASSWGAVVNQRLTTANKTPIVDNTRVRPIMLTPLVLAMPKPMAQALGWPEKDIGWGDVLTLAQDPQGWGKLGHPEWGAFKLGKTNPNFSTSGLSATIATYYAATAKTSGLSEADLDAPNVDQYVKAVEQSVVHYGDTTLTFLENMLREDQNGRALSYASAVAVEEVSVLAYNRGDPGDTGNATVPKIPLVAVYPKEGTLFSDNPAYVLQAEWVDDVKRQGANAFVDFVVDDETNQAKALQFGFRPGNPKVAIGDPISTQNGVNPTKPSTVLDVPSAGVLAGIVSRWEKNRKTARVLMVIDVSGSMSDLGGGGKSKLELAQQAAVASLKRFKTEDEVGLWIFSTNLDGDKDYRQVVPIGPMSANQAGLKSAIETLIPQEGTGLYDSTSAAVQFMRDSFDKTKINAVILLTDGVCDDDPGHCNIDELVTQLSSNEREPIRVFTVAYGADADKDGLQQIATASQAKLYNAVDPLTIERVFDQVVSNF